MVAYPKVAPWRRRFTLQVSILVLSLVVNDDIWPAVARSSFWKMKHKMLTGIFSPLLWEFSLALYLVFSVMISQVFSLVFSLMFSLVLSPVFSLVFSLMFSLMVSLIGLTDWSHWVVSPKLFVKIFPWAPFRGNNRKWTLVAIWNLRKQSETVLRGGCQNFWKTWRNSSGAGRCIPNHKIIGRFFTAHSFPAFENGKPKHFIFIRLISDSVFATLHLLVNEVGGNVEMESSAEMELALHYMEMCKDPSRSDIFIVTFNQPYNSIPPAGKSCLIVLSLHGEYENKIAILKELSTALLKGYCL